MTSQIPPPLPRLLVLLAARNGDAYIRDQIRSILEQRDVVADVVVSDDASTDGTERILRSLGEDRVHYSVMSKPSGSAAQNFLHLIRETDAHGYDFVALSDQDDVWMPDKLHRAVTAMAAAGAAGYSSSVIAQWSDGSEATYRQSRHIRQADFLFEGAGQGCTFVLSQSLYEVARAQLSMHHKITESIVYHDWALYAIARTFEFAWYFDQQPSMWYRQHGGNDTGARLTVRGIKNRFAQIRTGRYRAQIRSISELCAALGSPSARRWQALETGVGNAFTRRLLKCRFCWKYGRRKKLDRAVTVLAAMAGWI